MDDEQRKGTAAFPHQLPPQQRCLPHLLPCPFCGYTHIATGARYAGDPYDPDEDRKAAYLWRSFCGNCGAEHDCFDSEADAIAAWNTRPAPVVTDELIEIAAAAWLERKGGMIENWRAGLEAALRGRG